MNKWYLAVFDGDIENEHEKFDSDAEAVEGFVAGEMLEDQPRALEIYECNDDECLTPARMVYPPAIVEGMMCPHCGGPLHRSYLPEYSYQCFQCDEDFYGFEAMNTTTEEYMKESEEL